MSSGRSVGDKGGTEVQIRCPLSSPLADADGRRLDVSHVRAIAKSVHSTGPCRATSSNEVTAKRFRSSRADECAVEDSLLQPQIFRSTNLGPKWSLGWERFVQEEYDRVWVAQPRGGHEVYQYPDPSGVYPPHCRATLPAHLPDHRAGTLD
jgi:hypothetical protein